MKNIEKQKMSITKAFELTQEIKKTAGILGISRGKIYDLMKKHNGKFSIIWE